MVNLEKSDLSAAANSPLPKLGLGFQISFLFSSDHFPCKGLPAWCTLNTKKNNQPRMQIPVCLLQLFMKNLPVCCGVCFFFHFSIMYDFEMRAD